MSGLVCWGFLQNCTLGGAHCFFQGESYIRQVPAPLAIYPLRTVLGSAFHFSLALLMVIVLTVCVNKVPSPLAVLSLVPTLLLLTLFGWSLAALLGMANVRFRDTGHIAEVGLQAMYFLTPILYKPDLLINKGCGWIIALNPVVPFLNLVREPLMEGNAPSLFTYLTATTVTVGFLIVASLFLRGARAAAHL